MLRKLPKQSQPTVIGISSGYHDSACALLRGGKLVAAAQEERFTRQKNDAAFPKSAFRFCLSHARLSVSDIDCVAYYENPALKLSRQLWMSLLPDTSCERRLAILSRIAAPNPAELISSVLGYEGRVEYSEHHLSHAASSYYFSGFSEAAILTVDGVGEWATSTMACGHRAEISILEQTDFPDSVGLFYSAVTAYLGFEVNEGEYKVMGLAPYGSPTYVLHLRRLITIQADGKVRLDLKYFGFLRHDLMYSEELASLLGQPPRLPESEILQFHCDVARSAQMVLEEILLEMTRQLYGRFHSEQLCIAGGVALNVVATSKCLRAGPFKRLFVQPAAGDAGTAIGAAAVAHVRLTGTSTDIGRLTHVYLGPSATSTEIWRLLNSTSAPYSDYRDRAAALFEDVVNELIEGKTVAWFQGRMEFGPRALGSRSIFADPRRPEMRDRLNQQVKMRESFRPFAPSVLTARAADHFDLDHASPFMLEIFQVTSSIPLPAVTHVDNSARVQTVDPETNPRFAALLEAFYRRTGCPILLNTSFNLRGEPIVCSPMDALLCFVRSGLDILVLEDFILRKENVPVTWEALAGQVAPTEHRLHQRPKYSVYTFF